jgi:hypothetical protein
MIRRLQVTAVAFASIAVAAGCGGSTTSGAGNESGAGLVSAGAVAYVAVDSDLSSSQWQKVDGLLKKFPIRDRLLTQIKQGLTSQKLDYDRDLKPALGSEVDVAVVPGSSLRDVAYAALTKPASIDKAKALVQKLDAGSSGSPSATRVVNGWFVVADKQAMIDKVLKGSGSSLADDSRFKDAFGKLPADALVKAYADGRLLSSLSGSIPGGTSSFGLDKVDWISASVVAKDNGLAIESDSKGTSSATSAPYASKLISGVPADALAFATFRGSGTGNPVAQLRQNPAVAPTLKQVEQALGIRLDDVFALLGHETTLYLRRGAGLPEVSLVLETPDTQQALTTIDRLAARAAKLGHAKLGSEQQDGLTVKSLNLGRFKIYWAGFDGRVLLTSGPTGIADYRAAGNKLSDASSFKDALGAAGAPDKTNGLLYFDLAGSVPLIESYAALGGTKVPANLSESLKPLRSFVAYAVSSGGVGNATAFLELK